jgi:phosphoserine phosphatase
MPHTPNHALVLTGTPGSGALGDAQIQALRPLLGGLPIAQERWLAPGEAWEARLALGADGAAGDVRRRIAAALGAQPIDVNVVVHAEAHRRKRLLVADMEATIIEQECLDELADYVGLRPRIAAITERAMRGELDFEAAIKERVGLLKGLDAGVLDEVYRQRVTLMPGAATLVATMHAHGATCALVSGGFSFFTAKVAARVGFDTEQANRLEIAGGKIAGTVAEPILGREAKLDTLNELQQRFRLAKDETLAIGDGANDIPMIEAAGLGVAYHGKPVVAQAAAARIDHGDLTALLYAQGYSRAEFVTP